MIVEPLPELSGSRVAEGNAAVVSESRRHTRRSFVVAAAAAAAGYGAYQWVNHLPEEEMQPAGYRKVFDTNAAISRAVFDDRGLAPTYPLSKAQDLRVNGIYGLKQMLEPTSYRLQLVGSTATGSDPRYTPDVTAWKYIYLDAKTMENQGHDTKTPPPSAKTAEKMAPASMLEMAKQQQDRTQRMPRGKEEAGESRSTLPVGTPGLLLTMEDILKLPRHEMVTQFKCIEGWSQIVHWAGVRMADFIEAYPPALINGKEPSYVYMETPEGDYYTGYDLHVCRHPQTLLVTEMMGAPLTQYHGAPLRLHMPIKYGYKQIKRVGLINYTDSKPDDYWTKLGYDWYAGL
ncbi:MAG: molybdopterin-dependent oxidoreductase [Acidobacteria bacterium]|nr:molybdopterin-dependent oxidoreductase [Acidobacteriota bacterium]